MPQDDGPSAKPASAPVPPSAPPRPGPGASTPASARTAAGVTTAPAASAEIVLARLRDAADGATADTLAALLVEEAMLRPLDVLIDPAAYARAARDVLAAATATDHSGARVVTLFDRVVDDLAKERRTLREVLPPSIARGVPGFADVKAIPPRDAVRRLLDRPPLRKFLRGQVLDTVVSFGRKATSPVAGSSVAKGIGGFLGSVAKSSGSLGSLASAVTGEVEKQLEKRAADFADSAVAAVLDGIAAQVATRKHPQETAEFRAAVLDGLLEWTGIDSAATVKGEGGAIVGKVRRILAEWTADPAFVTDVEGAIRGVIAWEEGRTLGEILAEYGVREVVTQHARGIVRARIVDVTSTRAFATWLDTLLAP